MWGERNFIIHLCETSGRFNWHLADVASQNRGLRHNIHFCLFGANMIYLWPLYYYEVGCWLVWSGAYSLTGAKILVNSSLKKVLCPPYMQLLFLLGGCTTPLFPTQAVFVGVGCQQRLSPAFLFVLRLPCDHCVVTQDCSHFVGGLWRVLPRQAELLLFYAVFIPWSWKKLI